jgi:glycogen operon protein
MTLAGSIIGPGVSRPLGATWTGEGVNFTLFSEHATDVELCLFDATGQVELQRLFLPGRTGPVWHGFLPASLARPGTLYGFRVHGPYDPARGQRFNPRKLLLDPCALDVVGEPTPHPALSGGANGVADPLDSAPFVPRSRVIDTTFDWGGSRAPGTPWRDTVIYELHVKGFTQLHPEVPPPWRGKYLGLTVPAVIDHLKRLGVTAVELLPCHAMASEPFLADRGLTNYWGYNPLGWFAPTRRYAVADPVGEFKQMVRALHEAGIEVILDVVFNHTAEGGEPGLTLGLRGIDNLTWYRVLPHDPAHYENFTGCGNTVNTDHPGVRQVILDCLRYWARQLRVDGFRFDLGTVLGRDAAGFTPRAPLFAAIRSDPALSYCKLIAEPWDVGPGGYRLGGFPAGWSEWNDRYRDTVRAFWRGDAGQVPALAERLAGSSDLFRSAGRRPRASINFVTAHDGFTLADLVSYNERHNEANLEGNVDGHGENLSSNYGVEGPTDDPAILALRQRQMRNLLATLLLSQGVPMLQAGDEFARSQGGNNNAYCQDNEIGWLAWPAAGDERATDLTGFTAALIALRQRRPELRRDTFFKGSPREGRQPDVRWLHPAGRDMFGGDWTDEALRCLGMLLGASSDRRDDLLVILSAAPGDTGFLLPDDVTGRWRVCLDSAASLSSPGGGIVEFDGRLTGPCLKVLERIA